ncbi:MAG: lysophospholipid acyltransferase family protein [Akkermansia sp.]|nr:lysophospholipid acyltransferase family protein [Akkermansia sp.]
MSSELRKKWWTVPVGHLVWFFITLICFTLRKKVVLEDSDGKPMGSFQCIIALWHNRVFVPCYVYRYVIKGKKVQMSMLTSASKDGALLATVAKDYGMRAVRGSSRRRGVAGFMDMLREVKDGCSMCITPDGPKGPIYKCHPGVIKLASVSGLPIVPARISYSSYWRIKKAWDGFIIPKPFSRVVVHLAKCIEVPADLTSEQQQEYCEKLNQALAAGTPDFEPIHPEKS